MILIYFLQGGYSAISTLPVTLTVADNGASYECHAENNVTRNVVMDSILMNVFCRFQSLLLYI